jgi:hypothetical protein
MKTISLYKTLKYLTENHLKNISQEIFNAYLPLTLKGVVIENQTTFRVVAKLIFNEPILKQKF